MRLGSAIDGGRRSHVAPVLVRDGETDAAQPSRRVRDDCVTLTAARGPLSPDPAGRFTPPMPPGVVYVEPHPRRITAVKDGATVIDTERALLVHRPHASLAYAFPAEDAGRLPCDPVGEAPGFVTVPWEAVDEWIEEGRRLVHYPPNPYHRVDCRPTRRRLRVTVGDTLLVDTDDTVILFETAIPARLYVHPSHVRTELLHRSPTTTYCNYKGHTTYWSATIGDLVVADVAWSYPDPLPESRAIAGFLSFDGDRTEVTAEVPVARDLA